MDNMKLNLTTQPRPIPDPYIIEIQGKYYIFSTNPNGIYLYVSSNLTDWTDEGIVIEKTGYKDFWAPSVIEIDGMIYVYFSMRENSSIDVHDQKIYVASASSAKGPYTIINEIVENFSIDPHVVYSNDQLYMFYSKNEYEGERPGTLIVLDKMLSPTKMAANPQVVLRPTIDEEIFMRDRFKKGQNWHTIEGPFYFFKDNWHYLMYSGNSYHNPHYFIGYATCKSSENDLTKLVFTKQPSEQIYAPLISENDIETSTGHNSVLIKNNQYYVVYHGRDKLENSNNKKTRRTARICKMDVENGVLLIPKDHSA